MSIIIGWLLFFVILSPLILFFVWLFSRRSKRIKELIIFFEKNNFVKPNSLPLAINDFISANLHSYNIYQVVINKNGEHFPIFWVYGFPKSAFYRTKTNTFVEPYLLMFFPPYTLGKNFFYYLGTCVKTPTFKEILITWDVDHPIETKILPENYFMIKWQSFHVVKSFEKRLNWLYQNIC